MKTSKSEFFFEFTSLQICHFDCSKIWSFLAVLKLKFCNKKRDPILELPYQNMILFWYDTIKNQKGKRFCVSYDTCRIFYWNLNVFE